VPGVFIKNGPGMSVFSAGACIKYVAFCLQLSGHLLRRKCYVLFWNNRAFWKCDRAADGPLEDSNQMHDLIIGAIFVAMIVAPALVAARSGQSSEDKESA